MSQNCLLISYVLQTPSSVVVRASKIHQSTLLNVLVHVEIILQFIIVVNTVRAFVKVEMQKFKQPDCCTSFSLPWGEVLTRLMELLFVYIVSPWLSAGTWLSGYVGKGN